MVSCKRLFKKTGFLIVLTVIVSFAADVIILPTSESSGQSWKYTTSDPGTNWHTRGFNDAGWSSGNGGFGTDGTPGAFVRTTWQSSDIWLRKTFNTGELSQTQISNLYLRVHHDEGAEVYLNGVLAVSVTGFTSRYVNETVSSGAKAALISEGSNLIAVHCSQTAGGQYIDAGLGYQIQNTGDKPKLLGPHIDKIRRLVFTKHHVIGTSGHYAYTEDLSNAAANFNFRGNSQLCLLEIADNYDVTITTLLEDKDGVFRNPDVSWDGKRILFAWKKSPREDDYHLYEMDFATRKVTQLTFGLGLADYEGVYLPNGNIMFNSTRAIQTIDCFYTEVSNMYLMDGKGNYMRRIGYDQVTTNYPQVSSDGTITYTRWEYNDRGQIFPQGLFQMYPDGTAQTALYGNNSWFPTSILHTRNIPETGKYIAILAGHHTMPHGKLALIDPSLGREENSGITMLAPAHKLKDTIRVDAWGQDGEQWQFPYPLDENNYLVSYRPNGAQRFGLYFMTRDGDNVLLASDGELSCTQAVPLAARPLPSLLADRTDYTKSYGVFTMENVYFGQSLPGIPKGTIKKMRVVALEYRAYGMGTGFNSYVRMVGPYQSAHQSTPIGIQNTSWDVKKILGEADVYEDGSAAFKVPARTPVYLQAVDGKGHVVQTMRSWSTLMPGETFSCVGCHESKNEAVPPLPTSIASKKGPQDLAPFHDISGQGFSFRKMIQPILNDKCVTCHKSGNSVDLTDTQVWDPPAATAEEPMLKSAAKYWSRAYLTLTRKVPFVTTSIAKGEFVTYISPMSPPTLLPPYLGGAFNSPLIKWLAGGCNGRVQLTQREMDLFAAWIDLLVPYAGSYTENMKPEDETRYNVYQAKREALEAEELQNIQEYIDYLSTGIAPGSRDFKQNPQGTVIFELEFPGSSSKQIFQIPGGTRKKLIEVFNLQGKRIQGFETSGARVRWTGLSNGLPVENGFYIIRLKAGSYQSIRKFFLLR